MTILASNNLHKLREFSEIFQSILREHKDDVLAAEALQRILPIVPAHEFIPDFSPQETGTSFFENSTIKANYVYTRIQNKEITPDKVPELYYILSEDSGIEVDALGGEPGIYSARFGQLEFSRKLSQHEQNELILSKLRDLSPEPVRKCRYVCCITLLPLQCKLDAQNVRVTSAEEVLSVIEYLEGEIAQSASANRAGFGYDPIFFLPEYACTIADISESEKHKISHRGRASRQIAQEILTLRRVT